MINLSSYFSSFMTPRLVIGSAMPVLLLLGVVVLQVDVDHAQAVCAQASAATQTSDDAARLVAEVPDVNDVRLSPDGTLVVYSVSRGSVTDNQYVTELLLQALDLGGAARGTPVRLDRRVTGTGRPSLSPQWCPDSSCVTYFATRVAAEAGSDLKPATAQVSAIDAPPTLMRYEISSGRLSPIPLRDNVTGTKTPAGASYEGRPRTTTVGNDYRWSPKGKFIAFTALPGTQAIDPRGGVQISAQAAGRLTGPKNGLFLLDVSTGDVEQLSPNTLEVSSFDWAPDENALVIAASPDGAYSEDLFVIDRASHAVRPLVTQPGSDRGPSWSPDGKWVAFGSQFGVPTYYAGWPAVVPAAGGQIIRLASEDDPKLAGFSSTIFWRPDSRGFLYSALHRMTSRLIHADISAKRVTPVSTDEQPYEDNFSFSVNGRRLAFTRESLTTPPELFIQTFPDGTPHQLTRLVSDFPLTSLIGIDRVSWRSRDGKFTVHGVLLTPRSAWQGARTERRLKGPLPTLVYLNGGPQMVQAALIGAPLSSMLVMAARGYAVFAPNTRGRGGYGEAFERGMRDGPSAGRLPYEDMIAGVDELVRRGIADADRLGVYGHSYGGYLTAYTITQTNSFRAAVVWEGGVDHWFDEAFTAVPGTSWELLARDLHGIRNPFDPVERARLLAESPAFNMDRVKTPTLLLYGVKGHGGWSPKLGRTLFGGLQRFKIPSEFLLYDEGHGFRRPAAAADVYTRMGVWFDYWLRGLPYPDAARAREYDAWRAAREARQRASSKKP